MSFINFLRSVKHLTDNGINSRIARLNWVEDVCQQSASSLSENVKKMHGSRKIIYEKAENPHKAGNYYNSLMLYYEYVHGVCCPKINKK